MWCFFFLRVWLSSAANHVQTLKQAQWIAPISHESTAGSGQQLKLAPHQPLQVRVQGPRGPTGGGDQGDRGHRDVPAEGHRADLWSQARLEERRPLRRTDPVVQTAGDVKAACLFSDSVTVLFCFFLSCCSTRPQKCVAVVHKWAAAWRFWLIRPLT